jgi:MurNAc alpha-1-phosphate uridylyltransferase
MHGFILAAGFGKRMGAYTDNCPKPLLEIDGIKLLDYSLYLLEKWKIEKKIINTHYLSERIEEYFSNFTLVEIQISREKEILGTGGGIYTALQKFWSDLGLLEKFLVINPDTILFPSDEFHPDFPILFPDSLSHLYLKPIEDGKSYTTLFLKEGRVFFHNVELSPGALHPWTTNLINFYNSLRYFLLYFIKTLNNCINFYSRQSR